MARTRIIYSAKTGKKEVEFVNGEMTWCSDDYKEEAKASFYIQGDIQPYQSQIDGSMITSRAQHRNHLRQHGCIEIGNETKHLKPAPLKSAPGLKQDLIDICHSKLRYT